MPSTKNFLDGTVKKEMENLIMESMEGLLLLHFWLAASITVFCMQLPINERLRDN
jgi:hypothetical protein